MQLAPLTPAAVAIIVCIGGPLIIGLPLAIYQTWRDWRNR